MFFLVTAGSDFGYREAIYKLVEGVLTLRHQGYHDNLGGNDQVCDFEGLTPEQAQEKVSAIMSEPVGHSFDGCHACTWSISVRALDQEEVPEHLTYNEPSEAFAIREALKAYRQRQKQAK